MKQEIAEYFKTQLRRGNVKLLCLLCLLFISCVNKPSDEKKVEVSGTQLCIYMYDEKFPQHDTYNFSGGGVM